jgi:hypothetical protein
MYSIKIIRTGRGEAERLAADGKREVHRLIALGCNVALEVLDNVLLCGGLAAVVHVGHLHVSVILG